MLLFIQCIYLYTPSHHFMVGQYKRDMSLRYGFSGPVGLSNGSMSALSELTPVSHLHWPNHEMLAGKYASSKLVHFEVGKIVYLLCLVHYWIQGCLPIVQTVVRCVVICLCDF